MFTTSKLNICLDVSYIKYFRYLSSSPEKPSMKPQAYYSEQPHQPSPQKSYMDHVPFHSPPKNLASKQLLDQLHSSPHKGVERRREDSDHQGGKSGAKHRNKQTSAYVDPYLANNNKRKNNRTDNFVSDDARYRDHRNDHRNDHPQQDGRHRNDLHWREDQRDGNYHEPGFHGSPRKNYRDSYHYHDDPYSYHDNAHGYDARAEMHYRERPREGNYYGEEQRYNSPNSFMGPSRPGYQPPPPSHRPTSEPPNFDALKRRPGKGRGNRGRN